MPYIFKKDNNVLVTLVFQVSGVVIFQQVTRLLSCHPHTIEKQHTRLHKIIMTF